MKQSISPAVTVSVVSIVAILLALLVYRVFFTMPGATKHPREAGPIPAPAAPPPPVAR